MPAGMMIPDPGYNNCGVVKKKKAAASTTMRKYVCPDCRSKVKGKLPISCLIRSNLLI